MNGDNYLKLVLIFKVLILKLLKSALSLDTHRGTVNKSKSLVRHIATHIRVHPTNVSINMLVHNTSLQNIKTNLNYLKTKALIFIEQ